MRITMVHVIGVVLVGFASHVAAQFALERTCLTAVGGTDGPPDAADVAVLDLDNDGAMDIVTYNSDGIYGEEPKDDYLAILFGNGDGTFRPVQNTDAIGFTLVGDHIETRSRLMAGEFSGDANLDLVLTHRNTREVALLVNDGAGWFNAPLRYDTGHTAASLQVGDFNGDARDDVVVVSRTGYNVTFLAGTGAGTLAPPVTRESGLLSTYEPMDFAAGDLDRDGVLDVLVPCLKDELGADVNQAIGFRGKGDGTFDTASPLVIETGPAGAHQSMTVQIADLDADGYPDVAAVNHNNEVMDPRVNLHVAYGAAAGWEAPVPYTTSWGSYTELAVADLDFDGHLDIVTLCDGPHGFEVFLGDGGRDFASQGFFDVAPAAGMFSVLAADMNDDGKPDLVLGTQYNGYVMVYRNDTPGVLLGSFRRGDANADGVYNIADAVKTLSMLFGGTGPLGCDDAGDSNDDGTLNIADAVYTLGVLFAQGRPPAPPYPDCGVDPTPDILGCEGESGCP